MAVSRPAPGASLSGAGRLRPAQWRSAGPPLRLLVPRAADSASVSASSPAPSGRPIPAATPAQTEAVRSSGAVPASYAQNADAASRARRHAAAVDASRQAGTAPQAAAAGIPAAALGVAAAGALAVLVLLYKKFFAGVGLQATSAVGTLPQAVTQVGHPERAPSCLPYVAGCQRGGALRSTDRPPTREGRSAMRTRNGHA